MASRVCQNCRGQLPPGATFCPLCKAPVVQAAGAKRGFNPVWFVVIGCGCLGLIPLLGIVSAIFVPNFLDAMDKGRSKRTMADLRQLQMALVDFSLEAEPVGSFPSASYSAVSDLEGVIHFDGTLPKTDGWNHPYGYQCWRNDPSFAGECDTFRIVSAGKDGVFEFSDFADYEPGTFGTTEYTADLVISESEFVRYPQNPSDAAGSDGAQPPAAAPEGKDAEDTQ